METSDTDTAEPFSAIEAVCAVITSLGTNAITPKAFVSPPAITDHDWRELVQAFKELLDGLGDYDLGVAAALGALRPDWIPYAWTRLANNFIFHRDLWSHLCKQ